jgi:carbon-monoxide dehydrogenase medium subunit
MTNTHIILQHFDYHEPESVDKAIGLLVAHGDHAKILAGGTDLFVQMKMERTGPAHVVSINRIPELGEIAWQEGGLRLGARVTIRDVETLGGVRSGLTALAEACTSFSSAQVQSMGTLGGNLGNASPAADTAPALMALDAQLELAGPAGRRRLPVAEFFRGPGRSALAAGELITAVIIPDRAPGAGSAFLKLGRVSNDIAKASAAVALVRQDGRVVDCRLTFGSVGPTPLRARAAESLLRGQPWSEELVAQVAEAAAGEITPIDDVRSTARYRRDVVRVMAADALELAWRRAAMSNQVENQITTKEPRQTGMKPTLSPYTIHHLVHHVGAEERQPIELRINGQTMRAWVAPNDLLLNVLRDDLQLTGSKYGCGIGECSACTVLMDGRPVLSCLVLAVSAAGHDIMTIEGMAAPDGTLDPLQDAFLEHSAYQCGYCTPGMLLTAKSLLAENPRPSEEDVRHYLRGNLCRCTGYASIVRAVLAAASAEQPQADEQLQADDFVRAT